MQEIIAPESTFRTLGRKMCPDWSSVPTPMPCRAIRISGFSIWQTVAAGRHGRNHRPCTAAGRALMLSLLGLLRPRRTEHAWLG
jgi:hypothetical protein